MTALRMVQAAHRAHGSRRRFPCVTHRAPPARMHLLPPAESRPRGYRTRRFCPGSNRISLGAHLPRLGACRSSRLPTVRASSLSIAPVAPLASATTHASNLKTELPAGGGCVAATAAATASEATTRSSSVMVLRSALPRVGVKSPVGCGRKLRARSWSAPATPTGGLGSPGHKRGSKM